MEDVKNVQLLPCLVRLAQLQSDNLDRLALREAVETAQDNTPEDAKAQIRCITKQLRLPAARWKPEPQLDSAPALLCRIEPYFGIEWGLLRGKNTQNQWISEWWDKHTSRWVERADDALPDHHAISLKLSQPYVASKSPVFRLILDELLSHRRIIRETVLASLIATVLALAISFFSMQVYDRVIPSSAMQTLLVLTLGVLIAIFFEWLIKHVRSHLYEELIDQVDQRLARTVYLRFLSVRLDQMPQSVGALASQMRGYETIRGFMTSMTTNLMVDAPFALFFAGVIALIAGPLALIPTFFFFVSLAIGLFYRKRLENIAKQAMAASNLKTGLLVETIEGAETIKAGQGGWRMLTRWMRTTNDARESELEMRNISEHTQHLAASFQQVSYVLMVAYGAYLVTRSDISQGALIACSILSGRVLSAVSIIPGQIVQWSHAKAALQSLDKLWSLEDDHHGQSQPIAIENIRGEYRLENITSHYQGSRALMVSQLTIRPGEKIGILGPVGSGKTTLLRVLSGMFKPQEGRVLLDSIDLAHIDKPLLAEHIGYVQQDGRLFSGTLRDNLILGQVDPGDEAILEAARKTGLMQAVITPHPHGLQRTIYEGGTGLSGGQRQLVNLTRTVLRKPSIWLLDEPTASMDRNTEAHMTQTLQEAIKPTDTLVLVTHKTEMLDLVDRLIVVYNHQIALDGSKQDVLRQLHNARPEAANNASHLRQA
ncbi:MAG: ATP-binding cassette domain-containing protein [Burkholderiales bacterium]|nr:ATP-binding cassette domain-containing protein [Burkholderiales bacterium]